MTHTDLWKTVKENLKKTHPQHAFSTWFEPIVSIGLNNDELILEVPNQFFFEWIQSHYKESIYMRPKRNTVKQFKSNTRSRQRAARPTNREQRRQSAVLYQKTTKEKTT